MRLSRASQYGLEGLIVLARQPEGTVMLLEDIAKAGQLPPRFLAQIFQKLRHHHVVASHRGAVRGYSLAKPARQITLREIFGAIEGPDLLDRCVFWPESCDGGRPCRLHGRWISLKAACRRAMEAITLEEAAWEVPRERADIAQSPQRSAFAGGLKPRGQHTGGRTGRGDPGETRT